MASDAMLNFDAEHEKLTAKLKLFTEVIECRKLLEENEITIADLKRSIESHKDEATTLETKYRTKLEELKAEWKKCEVAWDQWYYNKPTAPPEVNSFLSQMYIHDIPDFVNRSVQGARSYESYCRENVLEDEATVEFMQGAAKAVEARHTLYVLEAAVAKCSVDLALKNQAVKKEQELLTEHISKDEIDKLRLAAAQHAWEVEYGKVIVVESIEKADRGANLKLEFNTTIKDNAAVDKEAIEERIKEAVKVAVKQVRDELAPLARVGRRVRWRNREQSKAVIEQNQKLIEEGNQSAHYGDAIADALVSKTQISEAWYRDKYGLHPARALELRVFQRLIQMLDWKGSLTEFKDSRDQVSLFTKKFDCIMKEVKDSSDKKIQEYLGLDNIVYFLNNMEEIYSGMYEKRRAERQKGRRGVY